VQVEKVLIEGVDILERIQKLKIKDNEVVKAVEEIEKIGVKILRDKKWREEDRLILKKRKVYVPEEEGLRTEVIWLHHNMPVGGHEG